VTIVITLKGKTTKPPFEAAIREVTYINGVFLTHEWDDHGNHRLIHDPLRKRMQGPARCLGSWVGYTYIAYLKTERGTFCALTEYHDNCGLPSVFKIVEQ
jgi:hypothetical protein